MGGKAQAAGGHFEVPSQSGGAINNVGGNMYVDGSSRRSASVGRVVAALGLALLFAGIVLLAAAGVSLYQDTTWNAEPIDVQVPGYAAQAGGLAVTGIILNRFGRLFAGH
jgi:hypothetical protein